MDFLQIRDRTPLTVFELKCIDQLKSLMTKEDTYTFLYINTKPTVVEACTESDRVRIEWLSEHENGVYVDTDCFLKSRWVPPNDGKCYLPLFDDTFPVLFIVFTNGNTNYLKKNFDWSIRQRFLDKEVDPSLHKYFYGWPHEILNSLENYGIVPNDTYYHEMISCKKEMAKKNRFADVTR